MAKTDDGQDDEGSVSAKDEPKQTKRRYNASCLLCRRKRQKCPGRDENGKNLCTSCEARGVPCEYPQNPDATKYDEALELRDLVDSLLRADVDHRNQLLEAWQSKKKRKLSDVTGEGNAPAAANTRKRPAMRASPPVISNLPLASNKLEHDVHAGHFINFRRVKECEKYVSAAIAPAIHTTTRQCYLTDAELDTFLDVFFRWHNPRFLFPRQLVYNHAKNPSYKAIYPNDLLISSIFTYASRHLMNRQDLGEKFCARAHCLLAEELCKEPSIATVQGIGLLSMHHATNGRNGQSLSLVGLAQKMMQAMSMSRIGRPRLEQRMFCRTAWAVFNWHVMFSLLMNQLTPLEAPSIADLKEELAPLEDEEKETSNQQQYCPEGGSDDLWKEVFLRSAEAFNYLYEILQALYANPDRSQSSMQSYVYKTRETLLQWQAGMSSDILIDTDNMPSTAPSPSIVQFNLLVRTLWILLYRRFDESFGNSFTLAGAKSASAFNAKEIYEICRNFEQNLSFNFLNYISIFAAEMAAVTDVHGLPRETPQQKEALCTRMSLYIRVLQTGEINCPGMAPMVEALRREKEGIDPCAEFLVTAPPSRSASCDIEVPESERDVTQLDSIWGHFRYQPQL